MTLQPMPSDTTTNSQDTDGLSVRSPAVAPINAAALIGLDWGTTSLRAYLLDAAGAVLASRALPYGIMHLPADDSAATQPAGAFDRAFALACGDWLDARPALPVLAAGMIGSAQGWIEAPYVDAPADAARLAAALAQVETARGTVLRIVPGVIARETLPNVMRGEETQIIGVATEPATSQSSQPSQPSHASQSPHISFQWVGLPGTHSKWVGVADGCIGRFTTFMTGELYSVLVKHTILGRTMQPSERIDIEAFSKGVDVARDCGAAGMLSTIFTTRTLGLTKALSPTQQADYLSGLLIGHELSGLAASLAASRQDGGDGLALTSIPYVASTAPASLSALASPVLIGDPALCERYRIALQHFGCDTVRIVTDAGPRGLARIARAAGLVCTPAEVTALAAADANARSDTLTTALTAAVPTTLHS